MTILYVGCVESSYRLLKKLIENKADVIGVITKDSSTFNSDYCDLSTLCSDAGIPCHYSKNINDADSTSFIKSLAPDICFCFGWSQLIHKEVIDLFRMGIIGFHPSALPMNRGRHPLIWALALGLTETASSFFLMKPGADDGDIISQVSVSILYEDDARSLYDKVMETAEKQVEQIIKDLSENRLVGCPQDSAKSNSWRKRSKNDGEIDWRMTSRSIYNLVRALTRPYIGAHFSYNGEEFKVWKVQEIKTEGLDNIEPGKVLAINADGTIDVKAGIDGIRLLEFDHLKISEGEYFL